MSALPDSLLAWVASQAGRSVDGVHELTGGASRNSFILAMRDGTKLFLRVDRGHGPLSGTQFTLEREYEALHYLQRFDLPIPRTYAFAPEHQAVLMEFVPGYTSYQKAGTAEEEAVLRRELMAQVVALQRIDVSPMGFLGAVPGASLADVLRIDLGVWESLYRERVTEREPAVEFAFRYLPGALPDPATRPVVVHGDVGPGNFLFEGSRIRALIDWELVRIGHPLEDVACIVARGLGAPFGTAGEHIRNYEELGGTRVAPRDLDYALVLVFARWMVGILMGLSRPSALANVPMLFAFRQLNLRALVDALCRLHGLDPVAEPTIEAAGSRAPVIFGYSREVLLQLASSGSLPDADRYRLRGLKDLVAYLQAYTNHGPERYEGEDVERIGALVGRPQSDLAGAREALAAHVRTVPLDRAVPLVEYLRWRCGREQALMREALNERADNVIAY